MEKNIGEKKQEKKNATIATPIVANSSGQRLLKSFGEDSGSSVVPARPATQVLTESSKPKAREKDT